MISKALQESYHILKQKQMSPLELLSHSDPREKFIELVLTGVPEKASPEAVQHFHTLRELLMEGKTDNLRVVVFGGGTGLSNIIGGDSRDETWPQAPFTGLKELFPNTRSVVCITDDGGSTGELLKDLPLIALGDLRHVLLSSVQLSKLQRNYGISASVAKQLVGELVKIFNFRFKNYQGECKGLLAKTQARLSILPEDLHEQLMELLERVFEDKRLYKTLLRPQCLGNLILASAIYGYLPDDNTIGEISQDLISKAIFKGLNQLSEILGAEESGVLPCTSTMARLRILYTNGVQIVGESRSSESTRGYPVDRVTVDFCGQAKPYPQVLDDIENADILIMAPGSLYSSIIPVFQVPGLANAVRRNHKALKILVANIWVQTGETDLSITDPDRKFHVSDMIKAYEKNIPGGIKGLFKEILCLSLKDVPASILQNYAVEGKVPIYLDRSIVCEQGLVPIECQIFSKSAMVERGVIKHDPAKLAQAVKTIFIGEKSLGSAEPLAVPELSTEPEDVFCRNHYRAMIPSVKFAKIKEIVSRLEVTSHDGGEEDLDIPKILSDIVAIIWNNKNIRIAHLKYFKGIKCVDEIHWPRDQRWDRVLSFYDPPTSLIVIRKDQLKNPRNFELAFLIALGESLLGNYAKIKEVKPVVIDELHMGKVYHLYLHSPEQRNCFFTEGDLEKYLTLSRMLKVEEDHFSRLINGEEHFTPPGLLMGLFYAWYLDNHLASHIEYKMSVLQVNKTELIPEQLKMLHRRQNMVSFFREVVFSF